MSDIDKAVRKRLAVADWEKFADGEEKRGIRGGPEGFILGIGRDLLSLTQLEDLEVGGALREDRLFDLLEELADLRRREERYRSLVSRTVRAIDRTPTRFHLTNDGPGREGAITLLHDLRAAIAERKGEGDA